MDEHNYALSNTPPCARYEGGENDDRLIKVWTYVAGLVGGGSNADELGQKVARLYDYKGSLVVATRNRLPAHVEALFRHAWATGGLGCEIEEHVEFHDVQSDKWKQLWDSRRFESDWRP